GNQVRGKALEGNKAAIGTEHRPSRNVVPGAAGGGRTHQARGPGLKVADKYIRGPVGIVGNQITGVAFEGDIAAVGADDRVCGSAVATSPVEIDTNQCRGSGLQVAHEDILDPVAIIEYQVVRVRRKGHEAAIGTHRKGVERG